MKILAGIILPETGDALVLERSISQADAAFRSRIGLLTTNERSFYWRLTGRQNLDFFAALYGLRGRENRKRVAEVLSEVGLESEADKPFRLYSSGMRQKLNLARALLGQPDVFLLDEPTVHLDPIAREEMHAFIQQKIVRERKATVLICTHDMSEAQKLADHVVLLHRGKVLAEGSVDSLRKSITPSHRVSLEFDRVPRDDWLKGLNIVSPATIGNRGDLTIEDPSVIPDIVQAAIEGGGRVAKCVHQEESLEEIFSEITGRSQ
jgi:ABC-2 type transport system ATP-binding protein